MQAVPWLPPDQTNIKRRYQPILMSYQQISKELSTNIRIIISKYQKDTSTNTKRLISKYQKTHQQISKEIINKYQINKGCHLVKHHCPPLLWALEDHKLHIGGKTSNPGMGYN